MYIPTIPAVVERIEVVVLYLCNHINIFTKKRKKLCKFYIPDTLIDTAEQTSRRHVCDR